MYTYMYVCIYVVCVFLQQIAQSLQTMLDYEGDDFEETFMASFQVSFSDMFDNVQTVNLREGGDQIPLTLENRKVQYMCTVLHTHALPCCAHIHVHVHVYTG